MLFGTQRQAITKYLKNIFESGELERQATCSILELVQKEGNRMVRRNVEIYNLDVIISVGYRVNTKRGIQFRQCIPIIFGTTFGTIFGTRKLFSKKIHSRGNSCNTDASACCMSHFTLQILQSSAQSPFRAEDFCSIIIEAHQNRKTEN